MEFKRPLRISKSMEFLVRDKKACFYLRCTTWKVICSWGFVNGDLKPTEPQKYHKQILPIKTRILQPVSKCKKNN